MSDDSAIFYKLISALDAKLSEFLTEMRRGVGDFMSVEHHYGGHYAKLLIRPHALSRRVFDAVTQVLVAFPGWSIRIHVLAPSKEHGELPDYEVESGADNPLKFERFLAHHGSTIRAWAAA